MQMGEGSQSVMSRACHEPPSPAAWRALPVREGSVWSTPWLGNEIPSDLRGHCLE